MANIEALFPADPEMTDEKIDQVLDRTNHITRIVAGGAIAATASVAAFKIWRRFHPYSGIDEE